MMHTTHTNARGNVAAVTSREGLMVAQFSVGALVVNFGVTAKVVGLYSSGHGPSEHDGHPILRAVGANGRLRGGKWVADPAKCSPVEGQ